MSATSASKPVNSAAAAPAVQMSANAPGPNKVVLVALPVLDNSEAIRAELNKGSGVSSLSWGDTEILRTLFSLPKVKFDSYIQAKSVVLGAKDDHIREVVSNIVDELEDLPEKRSQPMDRLITLYVEMLTQDRAKPLTAFEKSVVLGHLISTLKAEMNKKID